MKLNKIWVIALIYSLSGCVPLIQKPTPAGDNIFELLTDRWETNTGKTCERNPHTISFSDDRKLAVFKYEKPVHVQIGIRQDFKIYHVLEHGEQWVAIMLDNEKSKMSNGQPVIYRLYLSSDKHHYYWWRYDWSKPSPFLFGNIKEASKASEFGTRCPDLTYSKEST